jgi:hypothetical protein
MTKAIKFNLMLDEKPVRNLEGLKENFNLDDLLSHYNSGVLQRWLEVRGYDEYFKKVLDIRVENELGIAEALVRIFEVANNLEEIKRAAYKYQAKREREDFLSKIESSKIKRNEVIASYHAGYNKLLNEVIEKSDDIIFAKQALIEIYSNYNQLWLVDFERIFKEFTSIGPYVIFAILMNDNYRDLIMADDNKLKIVQSLIPGLSIKSPSNKAVVGSVPLGIGKGLLSVLINHIENLEQNANHEESDVDLTTTPFKAYFRNTNGTKFWEDVEAGKELLILAMDESVVIRSSADKQKEFRAADVHLKFPKISGVEYASTNESHKLIYMEV